MPNYIELKFEVCACGLHGRFASRFGSHEVATQEEAKAFIEIALQRETIALDAAVALMKRVEDTAMAEDEAGVDRVVLAATRDWNLQYATTNHPPAFLASRSRACFIRASVP